MRRATGRISIKGRLGCLLLAAVCAFSLKGAGERVNAQEKTVQTAQNSVQEEVSQEQTAQSSVQEEASREQTAQSSVSDRTVRVGLFERKGFYEKGAGGLPEGYGIDYLDKIAEKTAWQYEYIWTESWEEGVELLERQEIDLIAPAERTQERERRSEFRFSSYNIGMECGALLTGEDKEELVYEDFEAFDHIKTGCVYNTVFKDAFFQYAENNGFTPQLRYYKDNGELKEALRLGEVDAILVNLFARPEETKILAKFGAAPFYFMLSSAERQLSAELDDALEQIALEDPTFASDLMKKYYPDFSLVPYTKAELDYIEEAPVLTVGCRSNIRPVSYVDAHTGQIAGITKDILDEVSRLSGLKFEYFALPEGPIDYSYLREHQISMISSVEYNEENAHAPGMRLTVPYLESSKVFVCHKDAWFDTDAPLKIAVTTGSQTLISVIARAYPNFQVINYDSMQECFEAVKKGEANALLQNQYVVTSFLARPVYADMMLLPAESLEDRLCLSPVLYQEAGIADPVLGDSRLISVLDKTIRQLDDREKSKIIIEHTTEHQYRYTLEDFIYQYRYAIAVIVFILVALTGIFCYTLHIRKAGIRMVRKNEEKLRNITENVDGGVAVLTGVRNLHISYANEGFFTMLSYGPSEGDTLKEKDYTELFHPEDRKEARRLISDEARQNGRISLRLRMLKKDGGSVPVLFKGTLTNNKEGLLEIFCVIMDVSEQEELLSSLFLEQEKYDTLIRNSGEVLFEMDCKRRKFSVSPLFARRFGWEIGDMDKEGDLYDLLHRFRVYREDCAVMAQTIREAFDRRQNTGCTVRIPDASGNFLWCQISMYPMPDRKGNLAYVLGKLLDVDEEVSERKKLEEKSRTDALTGLMNKDAFLRESREYLRKGCVPNTALVFIDVDNFKQVNDTLGHMEGDRAIKETAKKLRRIFSGRDLLARFGGDEFCVLIRGIPSETLRDRLAWAVRKLRTEHTLEGVTVVCTVSIGAAYARADGNEKLERLLERADRAAYRAKEEGKDRYILSVEQALDA